MSSDDEIKVEQVSAALDKKKLEVYLVCMEGGGPDGHFHEVLGVFLDLEKARDECEKLASEDEVDHLDSQYGTADFSIETHELNMEVMDDSLGS